MGRLIELRERERWGRGGRVRRAVEVAERHFQERARRGIAELEAVLLNDVRSVESTLCELLWAMGAAGEDLAAMRRGATKPH
jgi:hypothetical protein